MGWFGSTPDRRYRLFSTGPSQERTGSFSPFRIRAIKWPSRGVRAIKQKKNRANSNHGWAGMVRAPRGMIRIVEPPTLNGERKTRSSEEVLLFDAYEVS